jgi:hypothetical protein
MQWKMHHEFTSLWQFFALLANQPAYPARHIGIYNEAAQH